MSGTLKSGASASNDVTSNSGIGDISSQNATNIINTAKRTWGAQYLYMVAVSKLNLSAVQGKAFPQDIVPAYSVVETLPTTKTMTISLPIFGNFKTPVGRGLPTLRISMYDTEDCIVEKAVKAWCGSISSISNDNGFDGTVGYLEDNVSLITIYKLDHHRNMVLVNQYKGYPEGDISITMGSTNSLKEVVLDITVTEQVSTQTYQIQGDAKQKNGAKTRSGIKAPIPPIPVRPPFITGTRASLSL
jgi:hypothetical protein